MICQSVVVKVASHVCKSGLFAPVIPLFHCHGCRSLAFALVVLHIELHGCRLRVFAPVGFNECCPELRQVPAWLRVLRNSPRAMPLFGLPIIVMTALYTSRKQGKLQRACAYGGPEIHVCRSGSFAPVIPLFHCHVCRSLAFAPVVGFMCANPALLPPSVFMDVVPNCVKGPLSPGCFASGIPQGRHLQMPGRSWRAGKAVWRWKARRP